MEKTQLIDRDQSSWISDLQDRVRALESKKRGNPAVVGLAGFGLTTMILQFHNFDHHLMTTTPVIWLGLVFGGAAQLIAGLQEYGTGNNFGYSAFTSYGAFWISLAGMLWGHRANLLTMTDNDLAFFLVGFTLYTFIMLIASSRTNLALFMTFLLLFLGFLFLDVAKFCPSVKSGFDKAAGGVLFVCAVLAWYVMAHLIYKDVFQCDVLPVGKPPFELVQQARSRRQKAAVAV